MTEMRGVVDTQKSNFWKESLKKEAQLRKDWHLRYSKEFVKSQSARRPRKIATIDFTPIVVPDPIPPATRQTKPASAPQPSGTISADFTEMRPATVNTHQMLYQGISHHGEGRYRYLNARKRIGPEVKFTYPQTYSMEYGWKITDRPNTKKSEFARSFIIKNTFFRPSGINIVPNF
ncbi:hypothetical protein LOD99_706 [Oopsacas minuta]|uniref:Sperm microtubule inner protein 1 C-terminal domain-containing protein n=1 Tax=Oopsacas minuta TaxID=111878 RepID=A0AAV7K047_9METZ|nr:hypothetical protein LOD99_706 [Oopsacas minuta]